MGFLSPFEEGNDTFIQLDISKKQNILFYFTTLVIERNRNEGLFIFKWNFGLDEFMALLVFLQNLSGKLWPHSPPFSDSWLTCSYGAI